jgi:hypothetical protein
LLNRCCDVDVVADFDFFSTASNAANVIDSFCKILLCTTTTSTTHKHCCKLIINNT